jgi:hypothetical protein
MYRINKIFAGAIASLILVAFGSLVYAADIDGCRNAFSSGPVGQPTIQNFARNYPSVGILSGAGQYTLFTANGKQTASSIPDLKLLLGAAIGAHAVGKALEIYFQGVHPQTAWDLLSSVRLDSANPAKKPEAYVLAPASSPGGGGGGDGGDGRGTLSAPADGDDPSHSEIKMSPESVPHQNGEGPPKEPGPPNGSPADEGPSDPWRAALPFKRLEQRYDWRRAEVTPQPALTSASFISPPPGYDPSGYSFTVTVPPTTKEPGTHFDVFVLFKRMFVKPSLADAGNAIEAALHDDSMRRATVRRATRKVINRLDQEYNASKAFVKAFDLIIVVRGQLDG